MTTFDERQGGFEGKFAHEEKWDFDVEARGCKIFGLKIAEKLGLDGQDAQNYAMEVVAANLEEPGFDDVLRKVKPDLDVGKVEITEHALNVLLDKALLEARDQIREERC